MRYVEEREIAIFDRTGRTFSNANTPEDWAKLQTLMSQRASVMTHLPWRNQ